MTGDFELSLSFPIVWAPQGGVVWESHELLHMGLACIMLLSETRPKPTQNCNDSNWPKIQYNSNQIWINSKCYWPDLTRNSKWVKSNPNWPELLLIQCRPKFEMIRTKLNSNRFVAELIQPTYKWPESNPTRLRSWPDSLIIRFDSNLK